MTVQSLQSPSANPLFDELANGIHPARRPLATTPTTTATRWIDRVKARSVVFASNSAVRDAREARPVSVEQPAQRPLEHSDLTAEERAIVAEMGGTVARLILQLLHEDATGTKRR